MNIDKRAFRAWVRTHHPDMGGDPEDFAAGLASRRAGFEPRRGRSAGGAGPGGAGSPAEVSVFRTRGGFWLLARWWRRRCGRRVR